MYNFENLLDQVVLCCDANGNNCDCCPRASEGHPTKRCREELLEAVFSELVRTRERCNRYECKLKGR